MTFVNRLINIKKYQSLYARKEKDLEEEVREYALKVLSDLSDKGKITNYIPEWSDVVTSDGTIIVVVYSGFNEYEIVFDSAYCSVSVCNRHNSEDFEEIHVGALF